MLILTVLQFPLFFTSASTTDQDFFNPFSNVHRLLFLLLLSINNVDEKSPAPQRIHASFLPSSLPHCLILSFFPFLPDNPFPSSLPHCLILSFFPFLPVNPFPCSLPPCRSFSFFDSLPVNLYPSSPFSLSTPFLLLSNLFEQRPRRGRSPVEHRGTFVRPFVS